MKKMYNVALIGCGHMGQAHIEEIYSKDNAHFTYLCDRDVGRAVAFQKRYGADKVTTDYLECISSPDVDVVIIATLPGSHLEILKACVKYKKHVLCEKPITASRETGMEFAEIVERNSDVKILIGHILRYNTTYQKVAELIQGDAIGSPIVFRMTQNHHTMDWDKYLAMLHDVSPLLDCGVHYVDAIKWFTGAKVQEVQAIGMRSEADVPEGKYNYGLITMRLSDGSTGYYEAGYSNTLSSQNMKEFSGPKGRITITFAKDRMTHQEEGDLIEYYQYPEKEYQMINVPCKRKPTDAQFDHLIMMIEEGVEAVPNMKEVLDAFDVVLKADEMIKSNYV